MFWKLIFNQSSTFNSFYCFNSYLTKRLCASSTLTKFNHVDVLKFFGCTKSQAVNRLIENENLQKLSTDELLQRLGVLQDNGIDVKNDNCIGLAKHHALTLKNRIMSMQEYGFPDDKITPSNVKKFLALTHLQIHTLRDLNFIDKNVDVYQVMLKHAQLKEHYYLPVNEEINIVSIKIQLLRKLLKDEIGMVDEELKEDSKVLKRLKNKSIRLIRRNLDIARNLIGLTDYRICRNPYTLWADPDNTTKIIAEIKEIAGIDVKLCMRLYPKIILSSYENLKNIKECLEEHNFSNISIQRALGIFTLSSKTVLQRLNELKKEEWFIANNKHSRVLFSIYYFNKIKLRNNLLKELKIFNTTINTLTTSNQKRFENYYHRGTLRQSSKDIQRYICAELECDSVELRRRLRGLPFWIHIPTVEIAKTFNLLKKWKFTNEDIFKCVQLLFYPESKVIEEFNLLETREGIDCCKKNDSTSIDREFILPLILYFIEKKYNFSSHSFGVGEENQTHSDIILPQCKN